MVVVSTVLILITVVAFDGALQQSKRSLDITQRIRRANRQLLEMESGQRGFLLTRQERYLADYAELAQNVQQNLTEAESISLSPDQLGRIERLRQTAKSKTEEMDSTISLARRGQLEGAIEIVLTDQGEQLMSDFGSTASEIISQEMLLVRGAQEKVGRLSTLLKIIASCLTLGSFAFALYGTRTTKEQLKPIQLCVRRAKEIAQNKFRGEPLPETGALEVTSLTKSINEMSGFLASSAEDVLSAQTKVETLSATLSRRAVEQSAALSQLSASIQQIASTVQELNLSANQMSENVAGSVNRAREREAAGLVGLQAVNESKTAAEKVEKQVQQVAEITIELNNRAAKVERIVFVVNELTERSNILSINAALLAANSDGSSTEAFAVLADEMQKLTTRSKESTLEIHETLQTIRSHIQRVVLATEETTKQVESGNRAAKKASTSIDELKTAVEEGNDTFLQVVTAVQQQSIALDQVDQAIVAMRESAEVVDSESKRLNDDAENLRVLTVELANMALLSAARS